MFKKGLERMDNSKKVYTVNEVAKMLGVSRGTAYECVKTGELPHIKLGRRIVVPIAAFEEFLSHVSLTSASLSE